MEFPQSVCSFRLLFLVFLKLSSDSILQWLNRVCLIVVLTIHSPVSESFKVGIAVGQSDHLLDVGVLSLDLSVGQSYCFTVMFCIGNKGIGYLFLLVV